MYILTEILAWQHMTASREQLKTKEAARRTRDNRKEMTATLPGRSVRTIAGMSKLNHSQSLVFSSF